MQVKKYLKEIFVSIIRKNSSMPTLILLISIASLLGLTYAGVVTTLSDGSLERNLTYTAPGNQTIYLKVPKTSNITKAVMDISGYAYENRTVITKIETLPSARRGTSAVYVNGKIYIFGGVDGTYLSDIIEYDPSTGSVINRSAINATERLPSGRCCTSAASVNGKIYIFGGSGYDTDFYDIIEYDPSTGSVINRSAINATERLPSERFATSAASVNGKIYIFGGYYDGNLFSDIIEYDPSTGNLINRSAVNSDERLPSGRFWTSAASVNGKIYVLGGGDNLGDLSDIIEYDPSTGNVTKRSDIDPNEKLPTPRGLKPPQAFPTEKSTYLEV
jgi:N-acetylneuraminic acid mutarotase